MNATALLVVDMLNHYEHEDAQALRHSVHETLPAIEDLLRRASDTEVPIVYVNDNHGDWSAGRPELCRRALQGPDPSLVEPIIPSEQAAFLVKARHSIFYETQLDYLLRDRAIDRIVLTGQVTEQCILYSALDAYVRHYSIVIPRDAVAHIHQDLADAALRMMETNMAAEITSATDCNLAAGRSTPRRPGTKHEQLARSTHSFRGEADPAHKLPQRMRRGASALLLASRPQIRAGCPPRSRDG